MLGMSLLGVGTVLRLDWDAWSITKRPRQATIEYPSPDNNYYYYYYYYIQQRGIPYVLSREGFSSFFPRGPCG